MPVIKSASKSIIITNEQLIHFSRLQNMLQDIVQNESSLDTNEEIVLPGLDMESFQRLIEFYEAPLKSEFYENTFENHDVLIKTITFADQVGSQEFLDFVIERVSKMEVPDMIKTLGMNNLPKWTPLQQKALNENTEWKDNNRQYDLEFFQQLQEEEKKQQQQNGNNNN